MAAPLTACAASLASHTISAAISSGFTQRLASALGIAPRFAGVSITLGSTTLAVAPRSAISSANVCTSDTSPALLALYAARLAAGDTALRDPIMISRPPGSAVSRGTAARAT